MNGWNKYNPVAGRIIRGMLKQDRSNMKCLLKLPSKQRNSKDFGKSSTFTPILLRKL